MNNLSLSEFIKLPDVKARFRQEFEKPRFSVNKPLLVPAITSNPQKIGTAFDYLLRVYANYLNPNAVSSKWVAEKSLEILNEIKDNDAVITTPNFRLRKVSNIDESPEGFVEGWKKVKYKYYSRAKITIRMAKKNHRSYLKTGKMGDKLIASALDLAMLDVLVTAGFMPPTLKQTKPDKNDMEDLRQLISIINPETFKADHTCVLNPSFGPEAAKLMSAAGDIVIDDILIDIKTVKDLKVDRKIFNQLLGYYTLYRIGGIQGMPSNNQINWLGVYFSRHGYLHTYRVEDLINESTYPDFIAWFKKRAVEAASM
ncbi:hypothetical protein ES708_11758 [subsurface metagenome]